MTSLIKQNLFTYTIILQKNILHIIFFLCLFNEKSLQTYKKVMRKFKF